MSPARPPQPRGTGRGSGSPVTMPPSPSILKDFNVCKCQGCTCRGEPRSSSCSESLHISNWTVSYAPDPQNIYW